MTPPPTCPRQARSGPKWTGAPTCQNHASELAVALAPAHAATLCLANMSCCGRLCLRRSHLRALGRHDGLERPPRGLRREGCCQRYLGGGGESRAGGASHHGPRPPPSCAAGERASDSYGQSVTGLGHPQRTARARLREPKEKGIQTLWHAMVLRTLHPIVEHNQRRRTRRVTHPVVPRVVEVYSRVPGSAARRTHADKNT